MRRRRTYNRLLTMAAPPLVDVAFFAALTGSGFALQMSQVASFTVAMTLNYLLKTGTEVAAGRELEWRRPGVLLASSLMVLCMRGAVLGLFSLRFGWPAAASIVPAVILGVAASASSLSPDRRLALWLIAYAIMLRLLYAGTVELLPEEAYYWNYSRHLDYGYLDHPPMVAWLIRLGTAAFGQSQFGVRAGALCCGAVTSLFTYRLARNLAGENCALAALLLAQVLPFFFLSGLLMTPDAPLTAAWAAALYFLERALIGGCRRAWWRAGLALGAGAVSKYSIGLLVPVTAVFMLWDPRSRRWWRCFEPYGAALLALAVFSPVILWNAQHEWASFAFQTSRRLAESPKFALHKLIASALVLITPTGVLAVAAAFKHPAVAQAAGEDEAARRWMFLRTAVILPLAVFAVFSLRHEVKLDWTGAPLTAALPVMAAGMAAGDWRGLRARIRAAWMPTIVIVLLILGAGLNYLALGLPGVGYGKHIELLPIGWRDLGRRIESTAAETGAGPVIVGMDRYAIASELAFYAMEGTKSSVQTASANLFGGIGLMYERWMPPATQEGRTLLLVAWDPHELAGPAVETHVERLGPVEHGELARDGAPLGRYYYRLAYNYHAVPRP